MKVRVALGESSTIDDVLALHGWLSEDPDIMGNAELSTGSSELDPSDMGGTVEIINVVLSNAIGLSGLILAILNWRETRSHDHSSPTVSVERDGIVVTVTDGSLDTVRRAVEVLEGNQDRSNDPEDAP